MPDARDRGLPTRAPRDRGRAPPGSPLARRPFTPEEMDAIEALGSARFLPGSPPKRFARDMREALRLKTGITERQGDYLRRVVHTFRRQLPARIVFALVGPEVVPFEHIAALAVAAGQLLFHHIDRREKAGVFGVFPSTAWQLIPIAVRPLGLSDFHCWAACGALLEAGRLRPMTDEDLAGRSVILRRYWPDPAPLMIARPRTTLLPLAPLVPAVDR